MTTGAIPSRPICSAAVSGSGAANAITLAAERFARQLNGRFGLPVTLVVLPLRALHQPPLDHLDGQPMARAAIERVRRLYEGNS